MATLPPPPINDKPGSFTWLEWYRQLRAYVTTTGNVPWYIIDFTGSNLNDLAIRNHNQLQSLQGGTLNEYYHLTAAEHAALTAGNHNDLSGLQGGQANQYYHLNSANYSNLTGGTPSFTTVSLDNLIFNKASGYGIKVDKTTPTYPWMDLIGPVQIRYSGSNDPTYSLYIGNIYEFQFATNQMNQLYKHITIR